MLNYFKCELKRSLLLKNAFLCLIAIIIMYLIGFLGMINFNFKNIYAFSNIYDFIDVFLMSRDGSTTACLVIIAPLLAAVIFSDSYLVDKDSGFLKFINMRITKTNYIKVKLLVTGLSSGLIMLISSLIVLIIFSIIYGLNLNTSNVLNISGPFSEFYYTNKWIYLLINLGVSFIFNVIFSILALGVSTFINNKYLSFLAPFFFYILSGTVFVMLKLYKLNATFLFELKYGYNEFDLILYQSILLIIGVLLFYFGVLYRNEKDL